MTLDQLGQLITEALNLLTLVGSLQSTVNISPTAPIATTTTGDNIQLSSGRTTTTPRFDSRPTTKMVKICSIVEWFDC